MIKTTGWAPDTCGCVIEYQWSTDDPGPEIALTPSRIVRTCAPHQQHTTPAALFAAIKEENGRKNTVLDDAKRLVAKIGEEVLDVNGNTTYELRSGVEFTFLFDPVTRVLTVTFGGVVLTAQERRRIQDRCDQRYGPGVVVLA